MDVSKLASTLPSFPISKRKEYPCGYKNTQNFKLSLEQSPIPNESFLEWTKGSQEFLAVQEDCLDPFLDVAGQYYFPQQTKLKSPKQLYRNRKKNSQNEELVVGSYSFVPHIKKSTNFSQSNEVKEKMYFTNIRLPELKKQEFQNYTEHKSKLSNQEEKEHIRVKPKSLSPQKFQLHSEGTNHITQHKEKLFFSSVDLPSFLEASLSTSYSSPTPHSCSLPPLLVQVCSLRHIFGTSSPLSSSLLPYLPQTHIDLHYQSYHPHSSSFPSPSFTPSFDLPWPGQPTFFLPAISPNSSLLSFQRALSSSLLSHQAKFLTSSHIYPHSHPHPHPSPSLPETYRGGEWGAGDHQIEVFYFHQASPSLFPSQGQERAAEGRGEWLPLVSEEDWDRARLSSLSWAQRGKGKHVSSPASFSSILSSGTIDSSSSSSSSSSFTSFSPYKSSFMPPLHSTPSTLTLLVIDSLQFGPEWSGLKYQMGLGRATEKGRRKRSQGGRRNLSPDRGSRGGRNGDPTRGSRGRKTGDIQSNSNLGREGGSEAWSDVGNDDERERRDREREGGGGDFNSPPSSREKHQRASLPPIPIPIPIPFASRSSSPEPPPLPSPLMLSTSPIQDTDTPLPSQPLTPLSPSSQLVFEEREGGEREGEGEGEWEALNSLSPKSIEEGGEVEGLEGRGDVEGEGEGEGWRQDEAVTVENTEMKLGVNQEDQDLATEQEGEERRDSKRKGWEGEEEIKGEGEGGDGSCEGEDEEKEGTSQSLGSAGERSGEGYEDEEEEESGVGGEEGSIISGDSSQTGNVIGEGGRGGEGKSEGEKELEGESGVEGEREEVLQAEEEREKPSDLLAQPKEPRPSLSLLSPIPHHLSTPAPSIPPPSFSSHRFLSPSPFSINDSLSLHFPPQSHPSLCPSVVPIELPEYVRREKDSSQRNALPTKSQPPHPSRLHQTSRPTLSQQPSSPSLTPSLSNSSLLNAPSTPSLLNGFSSLPPSILTSLKPRPPHSLSSSQQTVIPHQPRPIPLSGRVDPVRDKQEALALALEARLIRTKF